jgi:hypothetical protein
MPSSVETKGLVSIDGSECDAALRDMVRQSMPYSNNFRLEFLYETKGIQ